MRGVINLIKIVVLLALFPLLLLATYWLTLIVIGYLGVLLAHGLDTTFTIPVPLMWVDVLPQFLWQPLNLPLPLLARPALVLPVPLDHALQQFMPLATRATLAAAPYFLGFAALWLLWGYKNQHRIVEALTEARGIAYSECPPLYDALEAVCERANVPMPRLYLVRTMPANAFAMGLGRSTYSISVTAGLLAMLDREEVEAVLAHELSHIRHQDVRLFVVTAVMVGMFGWIASLLWTMTVHTIMGYNSRYSVHVLLLPLLLAATIPAVIGAFLSALVKLLFMREREIVADAGAAALTSPSAMHSALLQIASSKGEMFMPRGLQDMVIYAPADRKRDPLSRLWHRLWSTHPTFEKRLAALRDLGAKPRVRGPGLIRITLEKPAS